jgi:hypothetical protein
MVVTGRHRAPEPESPARGRHRSEARARREIWDGLFGQLGGAHRREVSTRFGWVAPPALGVAALAAVIVMNGSTISPDAPRIHGAPGGSNATLWPAGGHYRASTVSMRQVASVTDPGSAQPGSPGGAVTPTGTGSSAPGGVAPSGGTPDEPTVPSPESSPGAGDGHTMDPATGSPDPGESSEPPGDEDPLPPVTLPNPIPTGSQDDPTGTPDPTPPAGEHTSDPAPDPTTQAPTEGPTIPDLPVPTKDVPPVCVAVSVG